METFYITHEEFWDWFNRVEEPHTREQDRFIRSFNTNSRMRAQRTNSEDSTDGVMTTKSTSYGVKRQKIDNKPRHIVETEAASRTDTRYVIMWGRHKPGKKTKVWEGDGYLSLVGQMAHLCDLRGRMLEEPTVLDEIDYKTVEDLGELMIGNTEVQVVELDK